MPDIRRSEQVKLTKEARLLREIRKEQGLSIREVASRLGKSEAYLRHIENGRSDITSKESLLSILEVYGVSMRLFVSQAPTP